jgi:hypothetical protein
MAASGPIGAQGWLARASLPGPKVRQKHPLQAIAKRPTDAQHCRQVIAPRAGHSLTLVGGSGTWASWHVQSGTSLPELMELGGWKSYEMVLRYAQPSPGETLLRGRTHRAAAIKIRRRSATGRKRSKKRYVGATVGALMLGKFLIKWCARRDSNSQSTN